MTLSPEVQAIANAGPIDSAEMLRALAALGRSPDDVRTARELCEARRRVASTDAAIEAVRQFVRT